jgi:hypothetical protein
MNAEGPVLRDIHLPPDPAWWPPAPGWWLLALACLLIGWWCLRRWRTVRGRRRWRNGVFAELDRLVAADAAAPDPTRLASGISLLLRRASLLIDRRAAALSGEAWLAFLDRHGAGGFVDGPGRVLLDAPFRRHAEIDAAALVGLARTWLDRALPKERPDA